MEITLDNIWQFIDVFALILVRVTCVLILSPIFGRRNMPAMLKIGFGFMISVIILPMILPTMDINSIQRYNNILEFALLVLNEFLTGLILGFISYMLFTALYIAGEMIDTQIGFGMVNVLDPQSNIQVPIIANFLNIFAVLVFLLIDGHHMLISAIFYSYQVLPIGNVPIKNAVTTDIIKMFRDVFIIGFKIAAPIIAAIFVVDLILGILTKTMPQMNVFVVGLPFKIVIGLITIMLVLPIFINIMEAIINGMYMDLETIMRDMILNE